MNMMAFFIGGIVGHMLDPLLVAIVAATLFFGRKLAVPAQLLIANALCTGLAVALLPAAGVYTEIDPGLTVIQTTLAALAWGLAILGVVQLIRLPAAQ